LGKTSKCTSLAPPVKDQDGPALRALTLSRFAMNLLETMSVEEFTSKYAYLYESFLPPNSTIKADLEYISNHWTELSYDPWEESYAYGQFFNTIAFREALSIGAKLARKLGDDGAAEWYELQLTEVIEYLDDFWDPNDEYIKSSIGHQSGVEWKNKNLDTSVLIAILFANSSSKSDPYSLCTPSFDEANTSFRQSNVDVCRIERLFRGNIYYQSRRILTLFRSL
jgi:hypothetical protein